MTIIHKHIPPIHVHPILLVFIGISFITGTFVQLFIILSIVFFHEFGHFIAARFLKWRVQHIMLWVFGGVMKTEEHGTRPFHEEVLVAVAGPLQHIIIYLLGFSLSNTTILPTSVMEMIMYYNTVILLFNLLPIWPLDGGKILFNCLTLVIPYRKAYHSIIMFSMIVSVLFILVQLFVLPFTLSSFLIMVFLFWENKAEWKQRFYVFIRFLLQRYQGNVPVSARYSITVPHHYSLMDVFEQFRRDKKHSVYVIFPNKRRKVMDESDCLRSYFYDKSYKQTIGEIAKYL